MKRVRLITTDENNGKEAISHTPLRNKYFFEGAWREVNLKPKAEEEINGSLRYRIPVILRDAQIIEVTEAVFAELGDTFDIRVLTRRVESEMFDSGKQPREATIDRQLRQLRKYNKLNYEVVDEQAGTYRKLSVLMIKQGEIEFEPEWKELFFEFLKKEGAFEKFMKNKKTMPPFIKEKMVQRTIISAMFSWTDSREGWEYWCELDKKWQEVCDGKN